MSLVFITHDFQSVHGKWAEHLHPFCFTNIDQTECSQDRIVLSGTIVKKKFKYYISNSVPPMWNINK